MIEVFVKQSNICMLYSSEYQIMKYNIATIENKIMKTSKKSNDFVYFPFPFINGLKKLLFFLHFKLMITLSLLCIINIFLEVE